MRSILLSIVTLMAFSASAETLAVKGMHCGACAKSIEDVVCKKEGLKSCSVKLTNAKKKLGELTIETTDGQPVDQTQISQMLSEAGDYTLATAKADNKTKAAPAKK